MKPEDTPVRCRFYEHTDGGARTEVEPGLIGELIVPRALGPSDDLE